MNSAAGTPPEKTSSVAQIRDGKGRKSSGLAAERQRENFVGGEGRSG
jgi:hypothetical protein